MENWLVKRRAWARNRSNPTSGLFLSQASSTRRMMLMKSQKPVETTAERPQIMAQSRGF